MYLYFLRDNLVSVFNTYSTDYAILSVIDKVQKASDEGELSCGLLFIFQ